MSNIDFFSQNDVPQPREKIKIESIEAKPYPDGWRVRIVVDVTPFQERPSLEISVRSEQGHVVSELSVIETMVRHMEFPGHIRGVQSPFGEYGARASLYFGEDPAGVQHSLETAFAVEAG